MRTLRHYSAAAACVVFGYVLWEVVELWLAPSEPKPDALPKLLTALVITGMAAYQFHKNRPQFMALIFAVGAVVLLPLHFKVFGAASLTLLALQAVGRRDEPFAKRFSTDPPESIDRDQKILTLFAAGVFLLVQNALWRILPASISPPRPENAGYWVLLSLPLADGITWLVNGLGHALAGFIVCYRFGSLDSYPLKIDRDRTGLKLRIDWTSRNGGGYFGTPTRVSRLALRECVMIAGGPVAGLILVLSCWAFLFNAGGQIPAFLYALVSLTASASLVTNALNLWPPGLFGQKGAGSRLWGCMRGSPEFALRIAFRACLSSHYSPRRPREWNSEWLDSLRLDVGDATTADYLICSAIDRLDASPNDSQARADFEKAMATIRANALPPEATNAVVLRSQSLLCMFDGVRPETNIFDRIADNDRSAEFSIALFKACFAACDGDDATALQKLDEADRWQRANIECGFDEETLAEIRMFRAKIESGTFVNAPRPQPTAPPASQPEKSA